MPPRVESDIDPITLHNQAIINNKEDPTAAFEKLSFLLFNNLESGNGALIPNVIPNLLLLHVQYEYYNTAGDLMAEHPQLVVQTLTPYLREFLEALILTTAAPDDSFKKLEDIGARQIESLRKLARTIQEARIKNESDAVKFKLIHQYDDALEK